MKKGVFAVYKPKGITSYDVIRQLKKKFPGEKIGHGGTLDPLAEGVLVVGVGREATKNLHNVLKNTEKVYVADIELGATTETDDAEGVLVRTDPRNLPPQPTKQDVQAQLQSFVGTIQQTPPKYSAVKIDGQPAYKRARRGEEFVLEPKTVEIASIRLLKYNYPHLQIEVASGSGVYIRALARDIGKKLGTGAYLTALKRTQVGEYDELSCVSQLQLDEHMLQ